MLAQLGAVAHHMENTSVAHLQAFIDKFRYNAAKSSEAQSCIKKLEKMLVFEAPYGDLNEFDNLIKKQRYKEVKTRLL